MPETPPQMNARFWKQVFADLDPEQRPQGTKGFTFFIDTDRVFDGADRVRRQLEDRDVAALATSIRERGQVEPITVCRRPDYKRGRTPTYDIIHGHRRVAACRLLGQPVKARLVKGEWRGLNLVLNLTQADLSGIEIAEAIAQMRKDLQLTVARTAKMIGKDERYVERAERVAQLSDDVRAILAMRGVPIWSLFALIKLPDAARGKVMAEIARGREFSHAELRAMGASDPKPPPRSLPGAPAAPARPEAPRLPAGPHEAPVPGRNGAPDRPTMRGVSGDAPTAAAGADAETAVKLAVARLTTLRQTLAAIDAAVVQQARVLEEGMDLLDEIDIEIQRVQQDIAAVIAEIRARRRPRLIVRNDDAS